MAELKTIRETAKLGILGEWRLREMVKNNELPGIYLGRKFMVNVPLLEQQIEQQSRANSTKE